LPFWKKLLLISLPVVIITAVVVPLSVKLEKSQGSRLLQVETSKIESFVEIIL
jgi:hypothetical protein